MKGEGNEEPVPVIRSRFQAKVASMVPILTHNTLQMNQNCSEKLFCLSERRTDLDHAVFDRVIRVWVRTAALAVHTRKVLVVNILDILLFGRKELTGLPKPGSAITSEVALCVKLNLQSIEAVITKRSGSTSV